MAKAMQFDPAAVVIRISVSIIAVCENACLRCAEPEMICS